jgi:hypothetical protein
MKKLNKQGIKDYRSDHHSLAFAASTGARKTRYDSEGKHYNGYPDIFDRNLLGISKNEHQLTKRMLPVHQSLRKRIRGLESQKRRNANQEYAAFSDTLSPQPPQPPQPLPEHVRRRIRGAFKVKPGQSRPSHQIGSKIAAFLGTSGSGGRRKTRKHKKRRRRKTRLHRKTKRKTKKTRRKRKTRKRN